MAENRPYGGRMFSAWYGAFAANTDVADRKAAPNRCPKPGHRSLAIRKERAQRFFCLCGAAVD